MNFCKPNILKKVVAVCLSFGLLDGAMAQVSISHQLLGSTGNYSVAGTISISSSVGETAIQTFFSSNHFLTQGFQQPLTNALSISTKSLNSSCLGSDNGFAEVLVLSGMAPFQIQWQPGNETGSSIKDLSPGKYMVQVTDARGFTLQDTIQVGLEYDGACNLHIYSGITPNGDSQNDAWIIDGIEEFPSNQVAIFNRWGDTVWENSNYNNNSIVWEGNNKKNEKLPAGTYFYKVTLDKKTYKGWVELTR